MLAILHKFIRSLRRFLSHRSPCSLDARGGLLTYAYSCWMLPSCVCYSSGLLGHILSDCLLDCLFKVSLFFVCWRLQQGEIFPAKRVTALYGPRWMQTSTIWCADYSVAWLRKWVHNEPNAFRVPYLFDPRLCLLWLPIWLRHCLQLLVGATSSYISTSPLRYRANTILSYGPVNASESVPCY